MLRFLKLAAVSLAIPVCSFATFIDFSSPEYSDIAGTTVYEKTLQVEGYQSLSTELEAVEMKIESKTDITWLGSEGLGTIGNASQYVDGYEWLTFSFSNEVFIDNIVLSDFFFEKASDYISIDPLPNQAWYMINGDWQNAQVFNSGENLTGNFTLNLGEKVNSIQLGAKGHFANLNEFGIVGMDIANCPEPSALPLLSFGILFMGSLVFFKKKRA